MKLKTLKPVEAKLKLSSLPPIIVKTKGAWEKIDRGKPDECASCPFSPYSGGFVPDWVGTDPKAAILLPFPTKDDINYKTPFSGDMGNYILRTYFAPIGLSRENLIISYLLRCKPPWDKRMRKEKYPIGRTREVAETHCRIYDDRHGERGKLLPGGIRHFDPNIFLITFEPKDVFKVPSYFRQLNTDIRKLRMFINEGYRPLLLMGNEPAELFAPYIVGKGSSKTWRGHFFEDTYKFKGELNVI